MAVHMRTVMATARGWFQRVTTLPYALFPFYKQTHLLSRQNESNSFNRNLSIPRSYFFSTSNSLLCWLIIGLLQERSRTTLSHDLWSCGRKALGERLRREFEPLPILKVNCLSRSIWLLKVSYICLSLWVHSKWRLLHFKCTIGKVQVMKFQVLWQRIWFPFASLMSRLKGMKSRL